MVVGLRLLGFLYCQPFVWRPGSKAHPIMNPLKNLIRIHSIQIWTHLECFKWIFFLVAAAAAAVVMVGIVIIFLFISMSFNVTNANRKIEIRHMWYIHGRIPKIYTESFALCSSSSFSLSPRWYLAFMTTSFLFGFVFISIKMLPTFCWLSFPILAARLS